jgi:FO synthase subunit 2
VNAQQESFDPWAWRMAEQVLPTPLPPTTPSGALPLRWTDELQGELSDQLSLDPISASSAGLADRLLAVPPSEDLRQQADRLRQALVGETVTYVVNRNLNFTNHCLQHCSFCAFRRDPGAEGAYWHSFDTLQERAASAAQLGASELCIQGGLNPEARLEGSALRYYEALLQALHGAAPGLHLHAFSPQELLFIAEQDALPLQAVIDGLLDAGLGSIPGTAAEVLDESVRARLCPEKLTARQWCAVVLQAHRSGLRSTATLMAGHIESSRQRAAHLLTLVAVQQVAWQHQQAGFSEFVLLPFIGAQAPAPLRQRVGRDQPDLAAMLALTAQARLLLDRWIVNHQPSWVKLTLDGATEALRWGCNDLGGTLMEESITSAAGALGGTAQSVEALRGAAGSLLRPVRQRTTLYGAVPACV